MLDTSQDGRIGNLVAVEMQDRQHRAIGGRVEKLVGMPRRGQWSGFRLPIADDAGHDEIGIVEHCPERMAERITQFAAFVDRADRKSTRLNSSHLGISYAVFCL